MNRRSRSSRRCRNRRRVTTSSRLDVTDAVTVATPETALADAPPVAAASIEEAPPRADLGEDATPAAAPTELSDPVESPSVAEASEPISVEPDDNERRRAEARAIKARWMAAHDLDALIDTSGAGSDAGRAPIAGVPAATPTVRETGSGEGPDPSAHEPQAAVGDLASAPGVKSDDAVSRDESPHDESAEPERAAPLEAAANVEEPAAEVASETAAAVRVPATPAPVVDRDVAREASALDFAALDEIAGRREPTFDAPTAQTTPEMAMPAHPEMPDAARAPAIAAQDEAADDPRSRLPRTRRLNRPRIATRPTKDLALLRWTRWPVARSRPSTSRFNVSGSTQASSPQGVGDRAASAGRPRCGAPNARARNADGGRSRLALR